MVCWGILSINYMEQQAINHINKCTMNSLGIPPYRWLLELGSAEHCRVSSLYSSDESRLKLILYWLSLAYIISSFKHFLSITRSNLVCITLKDERNDSISSKYCRASWKKLDAWSGRKINRTFHIAPSKVRARDATGTILLSLALSSFTRNAYRCHFLTCFELETCIERVSEPQKVVRNRDQPEQCLTCLSGYALRDMWLDVQYTRTKQNRGVEQSETLINT